MKEFSAALGLCAALVLSGCQASGGVPAATSPAPDPGPTAPPADPPLAVAPAPFQPHYVFQGRTAPSSGVVLEVPGGMLLRTVLKDGARVVPGQLIGQLRMVPQMRDSLSTSAARSTVAASQLVALQSREGDVLAPLSGTLALADGQVRVLSGGIDAVVALNPLQGLRLQTTTFTASVDVEDLFGYRSAACTAWWVQQADSGPELHCRIPSDVQTAAGLPATARLTAPAQDAMAVPARYIGFDPADGGSYFVTKPGAAGGPPQRVPVVVGATDGVRRVILSGVAEGDQLILVEDGP